jgi:hypothetical protein
MIGDWNVSSYLAAVEDLLFSATYFVLNVYQQKNVPSNIITCTVMEGNRSHFLQS